MSTKKIPTVVNNEKAEGVSETPNIERQYADLVKKFVPMSYKEIGEEIRRLFPSFNPVSELILTEVPDMSVGQFTESKMKNSGSGPK